jgi:hypothetical protein
MEIRKAQRKQAKIKLALQGHQGQEKQCQHYCWHQELQIIAKLL